MFSIHLASAEYGNNIQTCFPKELAKCARVRGNQLISNMNEIMHDYPDKLKEVRGKGLLTAFEMHNSKALDGHKVSMMLLDSGIYAKETHHSTVRIAPALTIDAWQIDQISEAIRNVIKKL